MKQKINKKEKEVQVMTKREKFEVIKTYVAENEEFVAFLNKEIAALDAKTVKARAKRSEKAEAEAEVIKAYIVKALEDAGRAVTMPEVVGGGEYPTGKVVYYMAKLVDGGIVVKDKAKVGERKVMTYKLAE